MLPWYAIAPVMQAFFENAERCTYRMHSSGEMMLKLVFRVCRDLSFSSPDQAGACTSISLVFESPDGGKSEVTLSPRRSMSIVFYGNRILLLPICLHLFGPDRV